MPAPATVADLVQLVRKSNLIEPARLEAYLLTHPGPYDTPTALANKMRADGLLSTFHVDQLLRGRYRGFFLAKYKVIDRIGLGGMGQVFLAEHVSMKRRVAIKVLPPDRSSNQFTRERFLREARAAGQLDHPNLVRAFDVDVSGEVIFLVMEFVDGVSFFNLVTRHGPIAPQRAAYFLWQAANGLQYMSERGLVHRDVKPANLLVDRLGVVKLLDLGLVRSQAETDSLTRGEGVKLLGTADYLSPEQALDCSHVDVRADIYSLGATGYFLLTGKPPFVEQKMAQKLIAHQMRPVVPIHELRPDVPRELSAVLAKMLAKRTADRYQTPAEVVTALDRWAANPPPPPTGKEIPAVAGYEAHASAASVNLSWSAVKASRSGAGPGVAVGPGSSGSGIRYTADSNPRAGPKSGPRPDNTPLPAALAQPPEEPARPPAPRFWGTHTLPPLLPAASTHGLARDAAVAPLVATPPPAATGERPLSRLRLQTALVLALCLALAVAIWGVATLTGALSPDDPPAQPASERDGPQRAAPQPGR
jgi:serine/threonine protein kinase